MRINDNTYQVIDEVTNTIKKSTDDLLNYIEDTNAILSECGYEVFNKYANSQRALLIDSIKSLKKVFSGSGGLREEIEPIPMRLTGRSDGRLIRILDNFDEYLDSLQCRIEHIPDIKSDTSNPYIPEKKDDLYNCICSGYQQLKEKLDSIGWSCFYDEDDFVRNLMVKFQKNIASVFTGLTDAMDKEINELSERVQDKQNVIKNIALNTYSSNDSANKKTHLNSNNYVNNDVSVSACMKKNNKVNFVEEGDNDDPENVLARILKGIDTSVVDKIKNPSFEVAKLLASRSPDNGRYFTDHRHEHIKQVTDMSIRAALSLNQAIRDKQLMRNGYTDEMVRIQGGVPFSEIDDEGLIELWLASQLHDLGMKDSGYALRPLINNENRKQLTLGDTKLWKKNDNGYYILEMQNAENSNTFEGFYNDFFGNVRANHSLNSCYFVLKNREKLNRACFSDGQIDRAAFLCLAHSRSNSGLIDLNIRSNYDEAFTRIESLCKHDNEIKFNREAVKEKLSSLACAGYALRLGDVSRNSHPNDRSQSGEKVAIDRNTIINNALDWQEEVRGADIQIGEAGHRITNEFAKKVHIGEQNIISNDTIYTTEEGLIHEVTVKSHDSGPLCTQEALCEHIGEIVSASLVDCTLMIRFPNIENGDSIEEYNWLEFARKHSADTNVYYVNNEGILLLAGVKKAKAST